MPIYEFQCPNRCSAIEELRKMGDVEPPVCVVCKTRMDKVFPTHTSFELKGSNWARYGWASSKKKGQ